MQLLTSLIAQLAEFAHLRTQMCNLAGRMVDAILQTMYRRLRICSTTLCRVQAITQTSRNRLRTFAPRFQTRRFLASSLQRLDALLEACDAISVLLLRRFQLATVRMPLLRAALNLLHESRLLTLIRRLQRRKAQRHFRIVCGKHGGRQKVWCWWQHLVVFRLNRGATAWWPCSLLRRRRRR